MTFFISWLIALLSFCFCIPLHAQELDVAQQLEAEPAVEYGVAIQDSLEPVNRVIFRFNKALDNAVITPVHTAYTYIVPKYGRTRVHNFLMNLKEPVNILNKLLIADIDSAGELGARFLINSSIGVAGINDVAGELGIERKPAGFGDTLKYYGAGVGEYIMLPVLGPSSTRETVGLAANIASDPFMYVLPKEFITALTVIQIIDTKDSTKEATDYAQEVSLDEYATIRSAFFQKYR